MAAGENDDHFRAAVFSFAPGMHGITAGLGKKLSQSPVILDLTGIAVNPGALATQEMRYRFAGRGGSSWQGLPVRSEFSD
jgi:hypothetical protein